GQKVITPALTFFLHSWVPEESECWMANAICGFRPLIAYPVILLILSKFLVFSDRLSSVSR
ncbi:hypothetical protein, partial [Desulfonatronospira sp. MSAO_Bac3]|uniref:hypothetical protein n=1 Tax=Desulfonatronospira sp. MSAO_Bac3 TaxID=2293857 RepID=UPI00257D27D9